MGAVVVGTGIAQPTRSPLSHGARRLADSASRECLRRADYQPAAIDLLVNVGVYRERGLGEPALAALIQEDVAANVERGPNSRHGTFSFDIDNGGCGALTGLDVVRGFLTSHAIHVGMVVASDSGPGPLHARDLPRPESGGAMLLDLDDTVEGLSSTRLQTYPEYAGLVEGYWEWKGRSRGHRRGSNRLTVLERSGFPARASECAADTVRGFLSDQKVQPCDVDLLIATPEPMFADPLAELVGIEPKQTLHAGEQIGRMHTAQLIAAVDLARRTGRWAQAHTILLVSAGAGITVATALYRH